MNNTVEAFKRVKFCGIGDMVLHMAEQRTGVPQTDCRLYCSQAKADDGRCISYNLSQEALRETA